MAETNEIMNEPIMEPEMSSEEMRQNIIAKKEDIAETVEEVGERIQEKFDWRVYVGQSPFLALGVAAGIGFLASAMLPKPPTTVERITGTIGEAVSDRVGGLLRGVRRTAFRSTLGSLALMMAVGLAKRAATEAILGQGSGCSSMPRHVPTPPLGATEAE